MRMSRRLASLPGARDVLYYSLNDRHTDITGGYARFSNGSISTEADGSLRCRVEAGTGSGSNFFSTVNKVDLSRIRRIVIDAKKDNASSVYIGISASKDALEGEEDVMYLGISSTSRAEYTLNVPSGTVEKYIVFRVWRNGSGTRGATNIYEIRGER